MHTGTPLQLSTVGIGLFGGLAIFLYGMDQMANALKMLAGGRMKMLLGRLTANRFTAALAGAVVTAIIQSSSVTTVLVVGFVTAQLMTLSQSMGVIMGANIGSTMTAQLVAFKVTQYALLLVGVGFLLLFTTKRQRLRQIGTAIMGVGMVFFGMQLMSDATQPLRSFQPFIDLMQGIRTPILAVLISALFTGIIQSSAATLGIIIVLASQGFIELETGIALAFGANIGTCITALLAAIGKPREAVRAAIAHVVFNVLGVVIWFGFIDELAELVRIVSPLANQLGGVAKLTAEAPRQIANAHTIFNVANTLLFIGFTAPMAQLVRFLVPDGPGPTDARVQPKYLDESALDTPDLALDYVRLELNRLGENALRMVQRSLPTILHGDQTELDELVRLDEDVDNLHGAIVTYLSKLSQENLLDKQSAMLSDFLAVANYFENIGDMVETDIADAGLHRLQAAVQVSLATKRAMQELHGKICWSVENTLAAVSTGSANLANLVIEAKPEINRLSDAIDNHLAARLVANEPNRLEVFRIETDIIENYRRIYYFAKRIAKVVAGLEMERSREGESVPAD